MAYVFSNRGISTIGGILESDTSISVGVGDGDSFPAIAAPDVCPVILRDASGKTEICHITARTLGSDTLTVARAQNGTSASAWQNGDIIECCLSAEILNLLFSHNHDGLYAPYNHNHDGRYANLGGDTFSGPLYVPTPAAGDVDGKIVTAAWMGNRYDSFDIPSFFLGPLLNGVTVLSHIAVRPFTLPVGLAGSWMVKLTAGAGGSGTSRLQFYKNGVSIGSAVMDGSTSPGSVTFTAQVSFAAGDRLLVKHTSVLDPTNANLPADLAITFKAMRVR